METRHKIINLKEEDDEDLFDKDTIHFGKKKDSDEDYNINEELYSDIEKKDEEEEEDVSYMMKKEFGKRTGKKFKPKKLYQNNENNNMINDNINPPKKIGLRRSFRKSLGRKKNFNFTPKIPKEKFPHFTNSNNKRFNKQQSNKERKEEQRKLIESQLDKAYFYQSLTPSQWKEIEDFINEVIMDKNLQEEELENFFSQFPNLSKGEANIKRLRQILKDSTTNTTSFLGFKLFSTQKNFDFGAYQKISDFITNKYYMVKPTVFEVHFFPNPYEEIYLINLITKAKTSLDIAMFTINNIRIADAIKNIFNKGVKLRIITDDQCSKMPTSNIYSLAALGISIKTDDSIRYYMHHKFCVIDNSVVVTGSFNWTEQAVNHNQENLLFLENKTLAMSYSKEFQKLWDDFEIVITKEAALFKIKEDEEKKRAALSRRLREKEKKMENENIESDVNSKYSQNFFSNKKRNRFKSNLLYNNNDDYQYQKKKENSNCCIF